MAVLTGALDCGVSCGCVFFFKQKTAYEVRISDWSSDVCSSDLLEERQIAPAQGLHDGIGGGFRLATVLGAGLGLGLGRGRHGDPARGIAAGADRKSVV